MIQTCIVYWSCVASDMATTSLTLLDQLCESDRDQAWPRFIALYTPWIRYWVRKASAGNVDIDELTHAVFVRVYEKVSTFHHRGPGSFRAWLRTVTINTCRQEFRRNKHCKREILSDSLLRFEAAATDPELDATEKDEYNRYLIQRVYELLKTEFAESARKAFEECVIRHRSAKDVASELRLSVAAVYQSVSRIRRTLNRELRHLLD